jgi:hypothetical protein
MSSVKTVDTITQIIHPATTIAQKQYDLLVNSKGCPCRAKGLEKLKSLASLVFIPRPIKDVDISANGKGVGHVEFTGDAMQILCHVYAFIALNDIRYARKAMSIQDEWNTKCMSFRGSNAPLEVAWGSICMVRAMEILKYKCKEWTKPFEARFDNFIEKIVMPNLLNRYNEIAKWNNNWILTIQEALLQIYLYKDNLTKCNYIIQQFKDTLPKCLIDDTGKCTETTRDLIHAQFQIGSIIQISEMCWHQGVPIYNILSNRILKCMEYHASILNGAIPQNIKKEQLKDVWFMPSAWEIGFNHFVNRCGLTLPHTQVLLTSKAYRPEMLSFNWGPGWLHYNSH